MRVASLTLGWFIAAILVHLCIWHIRVPKRQIPVLLLVLFAVLPIGLVLGTIPSPLTARIGALEDWERLHMALVYTAMALAYVVAYSPLEHRSPSMAILTFVADAKQKGCTLEEIGGILKTAHPVGVRLDDMVIAKMATKADGVYRLTTKGRLWAQVFFWWLKVLGRGKGG